MSIENRNLAVGTRLGGRYKKQTYICKVVIGEGEGLAFVLEGNPKRFTSLSAAASLIMAGAAVNGWRFWSVEGEASATEATEATTVADSAGEPKARKGKGGKAKRIIYRFPNQKGVAEGKTKWYCTPCLKSFIADGSEQPEACPEGHRIDDPEFLRILGEPAEAEPAEAEVAE